MKELLIIVAVILVGVLIYDDYSKRTALAEANLLLDQANARITELGRPQPQIVRTSRPSWFQERLAERPVSLDRSAH